MGAVVLLSLSPVHVASVSGPLLSGALLSRTVGPTQAPHSLRTKREGWGTRGRQQVLRVPVPDNLPGLGVGCFPRQEAQRLEAALLGGTKQSKDSDKSPTFGGWDHLLGSRR